MLITAFPRTARHSGAGLEYVKYVLSEIYTHMCYYFRDHHHTIVY